jgi:acetyl esterase
MSQVKPNPEVQLLLGLLILPDGDGPSLTPNEIRLGARDFTEKTAAQGEIESVAMVFDTSIEGRDGAIPVRVYEPTGKSTDVLNVVVFFHGGGWAAGDLESADPGARALSNALRCRVVSVDYRLAPEHPFPAAFDDCVTVVRHVGKQETSQLLVVAGESAGGNLAASISIALSDEGLIAGQLLINPVLDLVGEAPSYRTFGEGYGLTAQMMRTYKDWYVGHGNPRDQRISPLMANDLSGVAPTVMTTAGFDPLLDEGAAFATRLINAGVPITYIPMSSMLHGWFALLPSSADARHEFTKVVNAARTLFAN